MRGKRATKRTILPDPKYRNTNIAKFINYVMRKGKKSIAQKIVYATFDLLEKKSGKDPLETFNTAIKNVSPLMEVRSRRVGGATYQIPYQVRGDKRLALSLKWIIEAAKDKKGKAMFEKLAEEIEAAARGEGAAVKKRQDIERMAQANRAFAHFAR